MYVVMGATGHVGSATAAALLRQGQPVTIVTRHADAGADWRARGAEVAVADLDDTAALRAAFRRGRRAFLLVPPADPATDTDAVEKHNAAQILAALEDSGLEKVVAESTYGARAGDQIGDFGTLWVLEQGLRAQPIPAAINRAAYYMSNWDSLIETAAKTGKLPTMYPPDRAIPMVAPADLGAAAARRLMSPLDDVGVAYVEGPKPYSAQDVAQALAHALGRPVEIDRIPREAWEQAYRDLGFSPEGARSYTGMTALSVDGDIAVPPDPERGETTLETYIAQRAARG